MGLLNTDGDSWAHPLRTSLGFTQYRKQMVHGAALVLIKLEVLGRKGLWLP